MKKMIITIRGIGTVEGDVLFTIGNTNGCTWSVVYYDKMVYHINDKTGEIDKKILLI